jgi:RNA polymerase sigma-70 factor (ECF subfamily)
VGLSQASFEAAYRRLERALFNYLYRWVWDSGVCEDLIHDAFERIWKKRRRIDAEKLDALIWTTVINLARNHHSRSTRWRWVPLPATLLGPDSSEESLEMDSKDRRLCDALGQISPRSREVILLELYSGMSGAEIARMLGIAEGTVASRKHNAINRLRSLLEDTDK